MKDLDYLFVSPFEEFVRVLLEHVPYFVLSYDVDTGNYWEKYQSGTWARVIVSRQKRTLDADGDWRWLDVIKYDFTLEQACAWIEKRLQYAELSFPSPELGNGGYPSAEEVAKVLEVFCSNHGW